jgi:hypothetical protein
MSIWKKNPVLLYKIFPSKGLYKPTSKFYQSVVFPEPEGPTNAIVSPIFLCKMKYPLLLLFLPFGALNPTS